MTVNITAFDRRLIDVMAAHSFRLPIVRELPAPPAAAGARDLTW